MILNKINLLLILLFDARLQKSLQLAAPALLLVVLVSFAPGQKPADAPGLTLNQPVERQIKGGETHSFQFEVKKGFYAHAKVEQKNIDVVVSLFAPDGKLVVEMDGKKR